MKNFHLILFILIASNLCSQTFTKLNNNFLNAVTVDLHSVYALDLDNNYSLDIFLAAANNDPNFLFFNDGDTSYVDSSGSNLASLSNVPAFAHWADYDNDCDLDAYLPTTTGSPFFFENINQGTFSNISSGPLGSDIISSVAAPWADFNNDGAVDIFVANRLSGSNHLYINDGAGNFQRIDTGAIGNSTGGIWTASWGDVENDGDPDLFIGNFSGNNYLLINNGNGYFLNDTGSIVAQEGMDTRSGSWGDYNNDGFLDLFVGRHTNTNFLYENNGDGTFTKINTGALVTDNLRSAGSAWADLDNDGDLDLYVTQTGNTLIANNNIIYSNNGNGTFTKLSAGNLYSETVPTVGCAVADLNNDGFLDILNANRQSNPPSIFINDGNTNNFLKLRLYGSTSNRMAIGARVEIISSIGRQIRYINDESRRSINFETHFGLAQDTLVDTLNIFWPSGATCTLTDIAVNGFYNIGETICNLDSVPSPGFSDSIRFNNVFFSDTSKGTVAGYLWEFGDGDTSIVAHPSHNYSAPGTYEVSLTVYDNFCKHRIIKDSITVCPDTASIGFSSHNSGKTVTFNDTSSADGYQYVWNFGDGTFGAGKNPVHTYLTNGEYVVCMAITDSCRTKSFCDTITVCNANLLASFGTSIATQTASFTDSSINADTIYWDFGDGNSSTAQNPTHTYAAPGFYVVCQTVVDFCNSNTFCDTVGVCVDTAVANFNYTSNNLLFNFTSIAVNANTFNWNFGDGNSSTQQNPAHIYSALGVYNVCLVVSNDCYTDSICQNIAVCNLNPVAAYSYQATATPLAIQFNDQSQDAQSFSWDFGDGSSSTNQNPIKVFSNRDIFNVCLAITDSCGTSDSICQSLNLIDFALTDNWLGNLQVYPNPTKGLVNIESIALQGLNLRVQLQDLSGRKLLNKEIKSTANGVITVDLSNQAKGLYILSLSDGKNQKSIRISRN